MAEAPASDGTSPTESGSGPADATGPAAGGSGYQRHRSRRRRERQQPPAEPPRRFGASVGEHRQPPSDPAADLQARPPTTEPREDDRALRGLVGAGPSMLSLDAALRARDASRPTEEEMAEAERDLVIVRRQYVPTESLPPGVRPAARPR
jgi:hypothetical protein